MDDFFELLVCARKALEIVGLPLQHRIEPIFALRVPDEGASAERFEFGKYETQSLSEGMSPPLAGGLRDLLERERLSPLPRPKIPYSVRSG
jgi:hypothetical protein